MARYYFHTTSNGVEVIDTVGDECQDREEIKDSAVGIIIGMAQDELPDGDHHLFGVKVVDADGGLVYNVDLILDSRWASDM